MFFKLLFSPKPAFLALWSPRKNQRGSFKSRRPWCVFSRKVSLVLPGLLLPWGGEHRINKHEWRRAWSCIFRTWTVHPCNVMAWTAKIKGPPGASFCLEDVNPSCLLADVSRQHWMWQFMHRALTSHCTNVESDRCRRRGICSANCTCLFDQATLTLDCVQIPHPPATPLTGALDLCTRCILVPRESPQAHSQQTQHKEKDLQSRSSQVIAQFVHQQQKIVRFIKNRVTTSTCD